MTSTDMTWDMDDKPVPVGYVDAFLLQVYTKCHDETQKEHTLSFGYTNSGSKGILLCNATKITLGTLLSVDKAK